MSNSSWDILDDLHEGIMILDENLKIVVWNRSMEHIVEETKSSVCGRDFFEVLSIFQKNYYNDAIARVLKTGCRMFFSAAMHPLLSGPKGKYNLNVSRFERDGSYFLLFELIDVTNQFEQIHRLKEYVSELSQVNTQLKAQEQTIKNLAYFDHLTGVANRVFLYRIANRLLRRAEWHKRFLGLMFIDVDGLKNVNDTLGHEAGDKLLLKAAEILKSSTRKKDFVVRHGGDEFLILLPGLRSPEDFKGTLSNIAFHRNTSFSYEGTPIPVDFSVGISMYPWDGDTIDKLITSADKAMYTAKKRSDGNDFYAISPNLTAALGERSE